MLNIYDLHKKKNMRVKKRQEYYKKILLKCYQKIVLASNNCKTNCIFKVPEFIIGMPIYNNTNCTKFLIIALRKNGFKINYSKPNLLYISWESIPESHYPEYQEPTQQLKIMDKPKPQSNYRNINDVDSNNLLYSNKLLDNLENRIKDIFH